MLWSQILNSEYNDNQREEYRERAKDREREIAENWLCASEWVCGLLIVEAQSWWLRNHRRPLWVRDVARTPKKVGDCSDKGGRPSQSILLPLVTLSLTPLGRLFRYWSFVVVVLDASRASISLSVLCCRERCDPRRLWDDYLLIGPQIRPRPIKV